MPRRDGHVSVQCDKDENGHCPRPAVCQWCDGGLFACALCNSFEGATTTTCPEMPMDQAMIDRVYDGELNYRDGEWRNEPSGSCASHLTKENVEKYPHLSR